ncbi:hypothetical protein BVY04_02000 [bacterium M21]|nr:hypothetical protein BVY04_02000 [bacterium M21]
MARALIVDDEPYMITLIEAILAPLELECSGCNSAEDALLHLSDSAIDFLIVDLMLPRMSGLELCRHIRNEPDLKELRIVMITAKDLNVDERKELMLQEVQLLAKPITASALLDFVRAASPAKPAN